MALISSEGLPVGAPEIASLRQNQVAVAIGNVSQAAAVNEAVTAGAAVLPGVTA